MAKFLRKLPRWLRFVAAILLGYLLLWLLTFFIGGAAARADAIRRCEIPLREKGFTELPYRSAPESGYDGHPVFACRVVAYFPLIVRVRIDMYTGGDFAFGTSDWYFWFGVLRHRYHALDWIT
jgi:hypothetical protein